jgi:hypothetical protein
VLSALLALHAAGCGARPSPPAAAPAVEPAPVAASAPEQGPATLAVAPAAPPQPGPSSLEPLVRTPTVECAQSGLALRTASPGSLTKGVARFAMASRGDSLAIAWVTSDATDPQRGARVHVASFSTALAVERHTTVSVLMPSAVAIAETPAGYMLAVEVYDGASYGIFAIPLAPGLAPVGPPVSIPEGFGPVLASRPGGPPLLVYVQRSGEVVASILDEQGAPRTRESLYFNPVEPNFAGAVFAGDGFLVALRVGEGVTVARVELDGRVGARTAPFGSSTEYPWLSWDGHLATMTFTEFGTAPGVRLVRLGPDGAPVDRPVVLGALPEHYNPSSSVATPAGTVIALAGHTGATDQSDTIDVLTIDGQGGLAGPACRLFEATPGRVASGARISRFGTGVAVAWIDVDRSRPVTGLTLARLAPATR